MRFIETRTPATLIATRDLTTSIREFLIRPDNYKGAAYPVGSHIDVAVVVHGQPETRSYSLVGEVDGAGYRIAVRRADDSRGGSRYMWSLAPGARLNVTLPISLLPIDWARQHYCLVAGGIGITPLIGAAQALARRNAEFILHYVVRSREDAAYLDVLVHLLNERLVVHAGNEKRRFDLAATFASLPPDAMTLFCGPMRMLDAARRAWIDDGRALSDLRYETFGSSGLLPTESFRVRLAEEGVEIEIPRDRSMLDALNAAGYEVISDCRRGECGVCAINLIGVDGEVDHRDVFFSEQQKRASEKICACVSRARGTITVDMLLRPDVV
ncbi:PDR/VanB family oxidoreductase [Bradyrhizobium sp. ISRA443]|uniref:PDR/VanB family oxidoreductase n=1 Tax=unclassified Bradyrhizobium TaxID=2631580 RepID=UPI002479536C|nr:MULTISPECIES: PDR/VanB family oxidoreductase [unclassified Bradyrhizobium]WGR93633.1 PDR/VanB family oxidoreductase [Bradyrhizobium sp. ISRA435]WGR98204.1 PDR/VanB family oxidoreductase [Bradyrhizobium sp. ISRA436]WGS05093.1 PDR/VanB family oxidoreductase [Bradyrhizobium sp. ISRA437]WGS11978.1 PDR/VanB family oxidoreductase [Bradyrhizobium sp. ISRA443]